MMKTPPSRREFLKSAALGAAALSMAPPGLVGQTQGAGGAAGGFKLKYAPSLGAFEASAGKAPADQVHRTSLYRKKAAPARSPARSRPALIS